MKIPHIHQIIGWERALVCEWMGWSLVCKERLRHTLPPTHVQKNVNEDVGAGATMASPLLLLHHPYLCPSLLETGAWRSCDLPIRPPTQHTHALHTNTHIHTWHVHAHLPIPCPPLPWIACVDTYSVAHAHVAEPASTTTLLQISQWAASVRGKIWSHWHLKIDGVTEYALFLLCRCLLNSAIITVCIYLKKKNTWQKIENSKCFLKLIWSKPKTNKIVHFNQIKCRNDTFCDGFFCLIHSYWTGFEEMTRFWLYPIIHFQLIIIILFGGLLCQVPLIKSCSWSGSRALFVYTVYHLYF